ncbi:MAG TPA: mechanosensitive ion channel domain-containing protein [Candidatus Saccharimonadia bacterium]|nr:mechanosensitive ion channel domain-containing protein [Candidatus Saccharimonadia bacterium]
MHTLDLTTTNFINPIIDVLNTKLPILPSLIFGLLLGILLIRVLVRLTRFVLTLTAIQVGLRDVIVSLVETLLWLFLAIQLLQMLGFNNIIVFFTGSIAALGLAMAAGGSTLVADVVAGIFLAQDNDFDVGDEVIVGETPTRGTIESMDSRRTRIRDQDGVLHVIPNSVIERKEWVVVHKSQELNALARAVRTAKKFKKAALESKAGRFRKNDQ